MQTKTINTIAVMALLAAVVVPTMVFAHNVTNDGFVVHMFDDRYDPQQVEVTVGEIVIFEHTGTKGRWPASNIHPTHMLYPGSDINKCGTDEEDEIFDACRSMDPGEEYAFTFDQPGTWRYHDHEDPTIKGTITVHERDNENNNGLFSMILKAFRSLLAFVVGLVGGGDDIVDPAFAEYDYNAFIEEGAEHLYDDDSALFSYVKKYGPTAAVSRLSSLSDRANSCHNRAHEVGRMAYGIMGAAAFQECSAECHSGCYHGATEGFFSRNGLERLVENLDAICNEDLNAFFSHQCIHGIGHGLMAWSDYELPFALESCDILPNSQASCYSGVFMENVVGGLAQEAGHHTEYLSEDPHFPCNTLKDNPAYYNACYFYQSSRMVQIFNGDFAKVAQACAQVDDATARFLCIESMGRDVGGANRGNPEAMIKECGVVHDAALRRRCLAGAAQDTFWDPSGAEVALHFCGLLNNREEKKMCYDKIIARAGQILHTPVAVSAFCDAVAPEWRRHCREVVEGEEPQQD